MVMTDSQTTLRRDYNSHGRSQNFLLGGPMYDVVEIVQFYQPNAQCMRTTYKFYPY